MGWCIGTISPGPRVGMCSSAEGTPWPERVICGPVRRRSGFLRRKAGGLGKRLGCWSVWRCWIPRGAEVGLVDGKGPEYGPVRIYGEARAQIRRNLLGVRPAQRQEGGAYQEALRRGHDGGHRRVGRRFGRSVLARIPRVPHGRGLRRSVGKKGSRGANGRRCFLYATLI